MSLRCGYHLAQQHPDNPSTEAVRPPERRRAAPSRARSAAGAADVAGVGRQRQVGHKGHHRPAGSATRRRNHEAFRAWASELSAVVSVFAVTGRDDYLLHLAVADTDALYAFVVDHLTERPEVANFHTSVVYEHIRRPVLEPVTNPRAKSG